MKITHPLYITLLLAFSLSFHSSAAAIDKGFEALKIYDYFKAKKIFTKSLKSAEPAGSFGLATIFYRKDNPFHSLDSAYVYINRSRASYDALVPKKQAKFATHLSTEKIDSLRQLISTQFFVLAMEKNSIAGYKDFIFNHGWSQELPRAIYLRDSLAMEEAKLANNSKAYAAYLDEYPLSSFTDEVNYLLARAQFTETTAPKTLESYEYFLATYPENPYRENAESMIYDIVTQANTVEVLDKFIQTYPDNHLRNTAWERLYNLSVLEFSAENIAKFAEAYPEYPHLEKLQMDISFMEYALFPFESKGLFGFMDDEGKQVIAPIYSTVSSFKEGLALVSKKDKFGYINKAGELVIGLNYSGGYDFEHGRAIIEQFERIGMIDRTGAIIFAPEFKDLGVISEQMIYGLKDSLYAYYSETGEQVIPERFTEAFSFSKGRAKVEEKGLQAYIDKKGKYIVHPAFPGIEFFTDSLLIFGDGNTYGLMKTTCQIVVPNKYDKIGLPAEGMAIFIYDDQLGYMNERGEEVIAPIFDAIPNYMNRCQFKDGSAIAAKNGNYGVINTKGKEIIPLKNENIGSFGTLTAVKRKGKWGFINRSNTIEIPATYDYAESFINTIAIVQEAGLYGVIDKTGKKIVETGYNNIEYVKSGFLIVNNGALYGVVSTTGQVVVPMIYRKIRIIDENLLLLTDKDGISYFDCVSKQLLKFGENE